MCHSSFDKNTGKKNKYQKRRSKGGMSPPSGVQGKALEWDQRSFINAKFGKSKLTPYSKPKDLDSTTE